MSFMPKLRPDCSETMNGTYLHELKTGDLIVLQNMWVDGGDLEPLLHVTEVSKDIRDPYIHVMIISGRDIGCSHRVDPHRHKILKLNLTQECKK